MTEKIVYQHLLHFLMHFFLQRTTDADLIRDFIQSFLNVLLSDAEVVFVMLFQNVPTVLC